MPLILLLALAGLAVVAAGGSKSTAPKSGCPVSDAEIGAAMKLPNTVASLDRLSTLASRLDVCGQKTAAASVQAKMAEITKALGGKACPVSAAEVNAAMALPNSDPATLTALGTLGLRLSACGQTAEIDRINTKVGAILAGGGGGGLGLPGIPGGLGLPPGGLGLAPPEGLPTSMESWGIPRLGFDPFSILTALGPVPGIDALPRPDPHDWVVQAVAYSTDPIALKTLANTLRDPSGALGVPGAPGGYPVAADEVSRAVGLIYDRWAWPASKMLGKIYRDRAFRADGTGVLDGLDYFALSTVPLPDGTLRKFCTGACSYTDLLLFQKMLNDDGITGPWTAEIAAAVARLKGELKL